MPPNERQTVNIKEVSEFSWICNKENARLKK